MFIKQQNPKKRIYLFEVSVPHLQNYHMQEGIKRTKYCVNSVADNNHQNFNTVKRDLNLVDILATHNKCQVDLGLLIVGCFGEVLGIPEHKGLYHLLGQLGASEGAVRQTIRKAAYSVVTSSCRIIMGHIRRTQ